MGFLSFVIWTPIVAGCLLLAFSGERYNRLVRWAALLAALVSFGQTILLYSRFNPILSDMQLVENVPWIPGINSNYHIGVDGISLWFVVMTAFITALVVLASWTNITERVNQYMGAVLVLSGLMIATFCVLDALMFYVFFEATLIPMYLIIGIWGGANRIYASYKFFLYTLTGSVLMMVAIMAMYLSAGTTDITVLVNKPFPLSMQ